MFWILLGLTGFFFLCFVRDFFACMFQAIVVLFHLARWMFTGPWQFVVGLGCFGALAAIWVLF